MTTPGLFVYAAIDWYWLEPDEIREILPGYRVLLRSQEVEDQLTALDSLSALEDTFDARQQHISILAADILPLLHSANGEIQNFALGIAIFLIPHLEEETEIVQWAESLITLVESDDRHVSEKSANALLGLISRLHNQELNRRLADDMLPFLGIQTFWWPSAYRRLFIQAFRKINDPEEQIRLLQELETMRENSSSQNQGTYLSIYRAISRSDALPERVSKEISRIISNA